MALASEEYASKAWVKFGDLKALQHPAITFVQGTIESVDCENLTATIIEHSTKKQQLQHYDYLIAASGLRRPSPVVPQSFTRADYLNETAANIAACHNAPNGVVIIGGGAVGVEMAAELKLVQPNTDVTLIHSRSQLLSAEPLPSEFKDAIAPLVRKANVNLVLGQRVTDHTTTTSPEDHTTTHTLTLSDSSTLTVSHVLRAISSSTPTTTYLPPTTLDSEGYVKISPTLHFQSDTLPSNPRVHFAAGDLAAWSGIKRCGAAMHMGHLAAFNLHQDLLVRLGRVDKAAYMRLQEHEAMMGLAVGREGVSYGPGEGVKVGEEVLKLMFGEDLGWSICWGYMRLGERNPEAVEEMGLEKLEMNEPEKLKEVGEVRVGEVVVASAA